MTGRRLFSKRFVRVAGTMFALAALVSGMAAGMPGVGDWLTQAKTSMPSAASSSLAGQSKESLTARMTELDALMASLRKALNSNPKNQNISAQLGAARREYEQISAFMGGDRAPVKGALPVGEPLVVGGAPPAPPGCTSTLTTFTNNTPVPIPAAGTPVVTSTLVVSGVGTHLLDLNVTTSITHTFCSDLDVTIQSPAGTVVTLTTDNGSVFVDVFNGTLWDDSANPAGQVPYDTNDGLVTDHDYVDQTLASPLVPEEAMAAFNGENPNGTWTITISDDFNLDGGSLNSWVLDVTTLPSAPTETTTSVSNNTPVTIPTGPAVVTSTVVVAGAGVFLNKATLQTFITHTFCEDLDITLQSPAGTVVTLTTDNSSLAGQADVYNGTLWDDDANPAGQVPYVNNNGLATDHLYVDGVVATPLVPEEAMGAFIGEDPNGTWTITISDDFAGDGGSLASWTLNITTATCVQGACTLTCPANVTVSNDANQCGAVVNYPPPTTTGTCGAVTCSPASGSFFPVGTTTVTCTETNATPCSFTITVNDTQPPTITCPLNVTAVTALTCPATTSTVVNFPPPTATDNCPGVTVACVPPSGQPLPVGTTTVTCTATDASGNTATCSFTVTTFDVCLQDDSNPATKLLINSATGQYRFLCKGVTFTGTGKVTGLGCDKQLTHNPIDRRVRANWSGAVKRGNAGFQFNAGTFQCTIGDSNMLNNDCAGGLAPNGGNK